MNKTQESDNKDIKQLTLRLPPDLHKALKIRAIEEDTSIGSLLEKLIRDYLSKKNEKT